MTCDICGGPVASFGRLLLLGKHDVEYFQCAECRFVRTEQPYWLAEAYTTAIAAADVGAVQRNLHYASIVEAVIRRWFDVGARFLDYGGGHGLFVRLMRDRGYDFRWQDRYAENIFARGFDATGGGGYELVTALEVIEHTTDPVGELTQMLELGGAVLFTTELLAANNPRPGEWWYYAQTTGQHISLFSEDALRALARRLEVKLQSHGSVHLLSRRGINPAIYRMLTLGPLASLYVSASRRRRSLVPEDYDAVVAAHLSRDGEAAPDRTADGCGPGSVDVSTSEGRGTSGSLPAR